MIQLRPATSADYDFLYDLHRAALKTYVEQIWGWDEEWQRQHFKEHFAPAKRQIIRREGVDVGAFFVEERADSLFLAYIAILPEYQRRGIGTTLIRELLDEAARKDIPVTLHVLKSNPARSLYERLGFAVVKETAERYVMKFSSVELTQTAL